MKRLMPSCELFKAVMCVMIIMIGKNNIKALKCNMINDFLKPEKVSH